MYNIVPLNLSGLDFKVKCDSAIGLPIYAFLFMFNSNKWLKFISLVRYKGPKSV